MKTKKLDDFKYITFGTLIVSIINCLISVYNLANAEMYNGTYSVLFILSYLAEGAGFLLLALGVLKNKMRLSAYFILVLSSFTIYFVELLSFGHNWTLLLVFFGFFAILLMDLYFVFSTNNSKAIFFNIIATLLFVYVVCSNLFLTFREILMGASLDWFYFLLAFFSQLAMVLFCIWYGLYKQIFIGSFSIKDLVSVEGYQGSLTEEEREEATRSKIGGWIMVASIVLVVIACFAFNGGTIAGVIWIIGLILFCVGIYLWGKNRNASLIKHQKEMEKLEKEQMLVKVRLGMSPSDIVDSSYSVTAARQKAQKKEETKRIVKGAVVGGIIAGEEGAVVGAVIAKNKIDNEKK